MSLAVVQTLVRTTDGAVGAAGRRRFWGVIVEGGTAATTVIIYDNTAASGTEICRARALIGDTVAVMFPEPRVCEVGIFVDITTTGGSVTVLYE